MLKVELINMHCSKCEHSGFKTISASDVRISLDLEEGEYVFHSICPDCKRIIINKCDSGIKFKKDW